MTTNNVTNNFIVSPLTTKGDLYGFDTANNRIPVGSNYYFPQADSSVSLGVSYQIPQPEAQIVSVSMNDFYSSTNGDSVITAFNSGTGASSAIVASIDNAHFGLLKMDMGTTNTGSASVVSANTIRAFLVGGATITIDTAINLSALSNGTDRYTFYFGLSDNSIISGVNNGCYISYSDNVNSGHYLLTINNATSLTTANASTGPAATTWTKLRLVISSGSYTAYAGTATNDYTSLGTVTATLPTANLAIWSQIVKSVGTTDTFCYLDWLRSKVAYTSLR